MKVKLKDIILSNSNSNKNVLKLIFIIEFNHGNNFPIYTRTYSSLRQDYLQAFEFNDFKQLEAKLKSKYQHIDIITKPIKLSSSVVKIIEFPLEYKNEAEECKNLLLSYALIHHLKD